MTSIFEGDMTDGSSKIGVCVKNAFCVFISGILFSVICSANSVAVKSSQIAPFSCAHGQEAARQNLSEQCKAINLVLSSYSFTNCTKSGDDGGYVEYYTVEAAGFCDEGSASR